MNTAKNCIFNLSGLSYDPVATRMPLRLRTEVQRATQTGAEQHQTGCVHVVAETPSPKNGDKQ